MNGNSSEFRNAEIFEALSELQREEIALGATISRHKKGDYVFHAGNTADFLYVVAEGRVGLYADAHDGVLHPITILASGQVLGLSALLPIASWELTARCLTDTALVTVPRRWLLSHMISDPDLELRLLEGAQVVSHRRTGDLVVAITNVNLGPFERAFGPGEPLVDWMENHPNTE
jgi:CRP-like cAMP-binding protein